MLDRVRTEIVVGFGGYVAAPAYLAARQRGLPIVVHEASARLGVANRLAARMTTLVFTANPSVRLAHATASGSRCGRRYRARPTRAAQRSPAAVRPATERAGTDGHRQFAGRPGDQRRGVRRGRGAPGWGVQVLHITGPQHAVQVTDGHPADPPHVVIPYVSEMQYAYAAADFVICRSGAMTCAELAVAGLPAATCRCRCAAVSSG